MVTKKRVDGRITPSEFNWVLSDGEIEIQIKRRKEDSGDIPVAIFTGRDSTIIIYKRGKRKLLTI